MDKEKLVPKLRFNGFDDEWSTYKLSELSAQVKRKKENISDEDNILTISANKGFISQKERWDNVIAGESLKKYTFLKKDEFSYNRGNSKSFKYGCIYRLNYENALVPNVYHSFKITNGNINFFEQLFKSKQLDKQLIKIITSTARMDGLLNISAKNFFNIDVNIPNNLKEQKLIGDFLKLVDIKLELLESKYNNYLNFKKYLMQEIFTQKLRFADINEYTLKQISEKIENGFSGTQVNYETPFPVTRIETISSGKINYDKVGFVNEIPERYLLKEGDILLTNINSMKWIGNSVYYDGDRILYHGMNLMLLRSKTEINSKYLYYYITYNNNWFKKMACQAVNQASINKSTLEKFIVKIPDVKTQNNIANVLTFADEKINGISDQIELSMKFKKGLLQQMFV